MLLYLHRRLEEAEQALSRASQLEPLNPQFLLVIVLFDHEMENFEKALPLTEELVGLRPDDAVYRQILTDIRRRQLADVPGPSP